MLCHHACAVHAAACPISMSGVAHSNRGSLHRQEQGRSATPVLEGCPLSRRSGRRGSRCGGRRAGSKRSGRAGRCGETSSRTACDDSRGSSAIHAGGCAVCQAVKASRCSLGAACSSNLTFPSCADAWCPLGPTAHSVVFISHKRCEFLRGSSRYVVLRMTCIMRRTD